MTAEAGRDWRIEEEDPLDAALEEDAGMSVEERLARDEKALDESADASGDEDEESAESEDTGAERVLSWAEDTANAKAASDAEWQEQWAEAQQLLPDYVAPRPEAVTDLERAAVAVSKMDDRERDAFLQTMRDANEKLRASYRAGEEGFDDAGEPAAPAFDPNSLGTEDFNTFMAAVASGGADPRRTPAGYTRESWSKVVAGAIGRE